MIENDFALSNAKNEELSIQEMYYLRLKVHGVSPPEICLFLQVKKKELFIINARLMDKFQCENWIELVFKCFEKKILKKEDYINEIVTKEAVSQAKKIYVVLEIFQKQIKANNIIEQIKFFLDSCDKKIKKKYLIYLDLTPNEKKYLQLRYNGEDKHKDENSKFFSNRNSYIMKKNIFLKLKVYDWFNCYRRVFILGILDKNKYLTINIENEIEITANKIINIINKPQEDREILIYYLLIGLYSKLEFNSFSKINFR